MAANGQLDKGTLALVDGVLMHPAMAAAWLRVKARVLELWSATLVAIDGYRDLAAQAEMWRLFNAGDPSVPYPPAEIGFSNHGDALAIDIVGWSLLPQARFDAILREEGFTRDVSGEGWHLHYIGSLTIPAGFWWSPFIDASYNAPAPTRFQQKEKTMLAFVLSDGLGKLGPVNKTHSYLIGAGYFEETTDQPTANQVSVLVNGFSFDDTGKPFVAPSPNLTYAELYTKALASKACSPEYLTSLRAAAGL